jgi:flavorubredoxin
MSEAVDAGLPRELAPGVTWLGNCLPVELGDDVIHGYSSVFLVEGETSAVIVDTGHPKDWDDVSAQLDEVRGPDSPPVEYLFPTHPEVAHAANLGLLLDKFPESVVIGDTRDYHLVFPHHVDRLRPAEAGTEYDLGGTSFVLLEAVIRDLVPSLWAYDTARRVLFPGDGFAYIHHHRGGECGKVAEEVPEMPIAELTSLFAEYAFYWTRFTDIEGHIARLDAMISDAYPVDIIAPGHGSPILSPELTVPKVKAGLRLGAGTR